MSYQKFTVGENRNRSTRVPLLTDFPLPLPPPRAWAAPYQQCSHGTAGRGGTTGPAGRESHPPALCSEAPGPGSNWGTGPDLEPGGPGGSTAPGDMADSREQAQSPQAPNSVPGGKRPRHPLPSTGKPRWRDSSARRHLPISLVPVPQGPGSLPPPLPGPRNKADTFSMASSSTILNEPSSVSW